MDIENISDKIKKWDEIDCEKHVINFTNILKNLFIKNNIDKLYYLDIGANVGKVYDILAKDLQLDGAIFFEASPILYNYLITKYKNNTSVKIVNKAISDEDGLVNFDESSIIEQLKNNVTEYNFGLSKISNNKISNQIKSIKISDFLNENFELYNKINFIKIDTENFDFQILNDLLSVLGNFKHKPVIEFEVNYFMIGKSSDWAQDILNKFKKLGYYELSLSECYGDGILIPNTFKI